MLECLKKNKRKIVLYGIIGFLLSLIISEIPYWVGDIKTIVPSDTQAKDILSFLGGYLSAAGSIVLACVAIGQTEYTNDINDRLLKLQENTYWEIHKPTIAVDYVNLHNELYNNTVLNVDYNGRVYYTDVGRLNNNVQRGCIEIKLINTGRSAIYNCKVKEITSFPEELKYGIENTDSKHSAAFNLLPKESITINLYVWCDAIKRFALKEIKEISLTFKCINDYNEECNLRLTISGEICKSDPCLYEGELVATHHPVVTKLECKLI